MSRERHATLTPATTLLCLKISTANQPPVCAHTHVDMHTNIQVCTQMDILAHLRCVCVCPTIDYGFSQGRDSLLANGCCEMAALRP